MVCKLTALLEYLDLLQNFHKRNFRMILTYEIIYNENKANYGFLVQQIMLRVKNLLCFVVI